MGRRSEVDAIMDELETAQIAGSNQEDEPTEGSVMIKVSGGGVLGATAMLRSVELVQKLLPEAMKMQVILAEAFEKELLLQRQGIANAIRFNLKHQKEQDWERFADLVEDGHEISYPDKV